MIPREEEAIGQHVKTNGKLQGISHSTQISIADLTPVEQIHSEVKRQFERECSHIDTYDKLFLLMQESYPSSSWNYAVTNPYEKIAISILKTGIVPKLSYTQMGEYKEAMKIINKYQLAQHVGVIPDGLLTIEKSTCFDARICTWIL